MDPEGTPESPSLREAGARIRQDFSFLRDAVEQPVIELRDAAYGFVDEHPLVAVGAAFGVGFVLAGGLFSRTTARALSFGTRFVVGKLLREALLGAGAGFLLAREEREESPHD
jgi:hypothetical protein